MEITILALALLLLTVVCAVLAGSIPWLWWKYFKQEQQLRELDETLAALLSRLGFKTTLEGDWQDETGRNGRKPTASSGGRAPSYPRKPQGDESRY